MDDTSLDVIDYEALVDTYGRRLVTVLRAFRPGDGGHAFLETWVPDEDDAKSVDGIFEAAFSSGKPEITLRLGPSTLERVSEGELRSLAERRGVVDCTHVDGTLVLRVLRPEGGSIPATDAASAPTPPRALEARRSAAKQGASGPRDAATSGGSASYDAALAALDPRAHEGDVTVPGAIKVAAPHGDAVLEVWVDSAQRVASARHRGGNPETRALLEAVCSAIEGLPLREVADHGGHRLELALRGRGQPRRVPGILSPENADPRVAAAVRTLRSIVEQFSTRVAPVAFSSDFVPPMSQRWAAASPADRESMTRAALASIARAIGFGDGAIELAHIQGDRRIVVSLSPEVPIARRPALLFDIERSLKSSVEDGLSVYMEEMTDKNRLRRLAQIGDIRQ
jgi:hypothetical protein